MPIPLKAFASRAAAIKARSTEDHDGKPQPGDCWPAPEMAKDASLFGDRHVKSGAPIIVVQMPDHFGPFCLALSRHSGDDLGFTVTGTLPKITVSPEINFEDEHRFEIRDGVLSDDLGAPEPVVIADDA